MTRPARRFLSGARAHHARAITIVVALSFGLLACDADQPTEPSAPSLAGTWTGTYRVTACRAGVQGCTGLRSSYAIRLRLAQTSDGISGTIAGDIPAGTINGVLDVAGSLDANTLHVRGNQPYLSGANGRPAQTGVELDEWQTTANAAGNSMTGRFHLIIQFHTNNLYPDIWMVDAELVSLRR